MKKIVPLFLIVVFSSFSTSLIAQEVTLGGNGTYSYPIKKNQEMVSRGVGGNIELKYFGLPQFPISFRMGYLQFLPDQGLLDSLNMNDYTYYTVPIIIAAEYVFTEEGFRPFVSIGAGKHISTKKKSIPGLQPEKNASSDFGFVPSVGAIIDFSDRAHMNLRISYNIILDEKKGNNDSSFFTFDLGLSFNVGYR